MDLKEFSLNDNRDNSLNIHRKKIKAETFFSQSMDKTTNVIMRIILSPLSAPRVDVVICAVMRPNG